MTAMQFIMTLVFIASPNADTNGNISTNALQDKYDLVGQRMITREVEYLDRLQNATIDPHKKPDQSAVELTFRSPKAKERAIGDQQAVVSQVTQMVNDGRIKFPVFSLRKLQADTFGYLPKHKLVEYRVVSVYDGFVDVDIQFYTDCIRCEGRSTKDCVACDMKGRKEIYDQDEVRIVIMGIDSKTIILGIWTPPSTLYYVSGVSGRHVGYVLQPFNPAKK